MNNKAMLIAFLAIINKEIIRIFRIWSQTLIPPVITIALYFVIFGEIIGRNIDPIHGVNYITYIIPGLVMNAVIINSFTNTASSFFISRYNSSIEEMIVSPMPNWLIIMGYVVGGMVRGLLIGILVIFIAYFFDQITPTHPIFTLVVVILSSVLFSILGIINALFAGNFDDVSWIPTFVLTPLIYLGGVFYPINALSDFWQEVSLFNPILYIVNAFRYGILEISSVNPYSALFVLFIFTLIAFSVVKKLMDSGVGIRK